MGQDLLDIQYAHFIKMNMTDRSERLEYQKEFIKESC